MRIGIIGFGRFGQIFAKHLKNHAEIIVANHSDKAKEAKDLGVQWSAGDEVFKVDTLIFCVPISETKKALEAAKDKILPGTVVMDACSVKVYPCQWMKEILGDQAEIIGTHPMFGPDSARETLAGRQMILCPISLSRGKLDSLTAFFKGLNLEVVTSTPDDHDRQAAKCLALTHFIGRALSRTGVGQQSITTLGFERLRTVIETVEHDSWQLFEDMNRFNPYAAIVRSQFIENAKKIDQQLKQKE